MSNSSKDVMKCQRRKKEYAVREFGGKCSICGYARCINALEFHHLGNKKESPSYVIMRWTWEKAMEELKNCILVCSNCHKEIHYKYIDSTVIPITNSLKEFTCKRCGRPFRSACDDAKHCGMACARESQRIHPRPTKEEFLDLAPTMTKREFMGHFGLKSYATLPKWMKSLNISPSDVKWPDGRAR